MYDFRVCGESEFYKNKNNNNNNNNNKIKLTRIFFFTLSRKPV